MNFPSESLYQPQHVTTAPLVDFGVFWQFWLFSHFGVSRREIGRIELVMTLSSHFVNFRGLSYVTSHFVNFRGLSYVTSHFSCFRLGYETAHPLDLESGKLPILAILQGKNACKGLPKIAPLFDIGNPVSHIGSGVL